MFARVSLLICLIISLLFLFECLNSSKGTAKTPDLSETHTKTGFSAASSLLPAMPGLSHAAAADNPFRSGQKDPPALEQKPRGPGFASWYGRFVSAISTLQKDLRSAMAANAREIKANPFGAAFWTFLLLSFGYGIVHALGPGHGKCFAVAYFATRPARLRQALFLGGIMPSIHVVSAVVLVLGLYWLFDAATFGAVQDKTLLTQQISYGLITLLGLCFVVRAAVELFKPLQHGSEQGCATTRSMVGLALAVGLIPCPAAAIILLFSITYDVLFAGLMATVFTALGMALTTTLFSAATILSRTGLDASLSKWKKPGAIVYRTLSLAGGLLIAMVGLTLFLSSL